MKILNPINVLANDYTTRTYTVNSCKLFAEDAYQASDTFRRGIAVSYTHLTLPTTPYV